VDADRRQHERDDRKRRQHAHLHRPRRRLELDHLGEHLHFRNRHLRIGPPNDVADRPARWAGGTVIRMANAFGE
jgi:hypothetical protein